MNNMLKLYDFPISMCAQKVRLVLAEKSLAYETRIVDLSPQKIEQLGDEYLKINQNGVVPSLEHDGDILNDSSAIAEYLDDAFPEPSLVPSSVVARARMRTWMRFFEEVTTPAARWPSWHYAFIPMLKMMGSMDMVGKLAAKQPHHGSFYMQMSEDGLPIMRVTEAENALRRTFLRMDKHLAGGSSYLVDSNPTLADFIVLPLLVRTEDVGLQRLWADLPTVTAWYDRMEERPSFNAVFGVEGVRLPRLAAS
jgi:glutathione S-transferase